MKLCSLCGVQERYLTQTFCYDCFRIRQKERYWEKHGLSRERECTVCGVAFVATHGRQIKCRKNCRESVVRKPKVLCPRCTVRKKAPGAGYCKQCRTEYFQERDRAKGSHRVFTCGPCAICGQGFVSANSNRIVGKYCSKACEKKATRRRWRKNGGRAVKYRGETKKMIPVLLADPCAYCGAPSAEIEHIVPRSRSGENTWENLAGACRTCNGLKSDTSLLYFLLR